MVITIIIGIVSTLFGVAAVFAGVGYWKQGQNQAKLDANTLLKDDVEALTKKVNGMADEIKQLRAVIEKKDEDLKKYLEIFQGRDPQMTTFLDMMKKYIETNVPLLQTINSETVPTIRNLQKYLDKQSF